MRIHGSVLGPYLNQFVVCLKMLFGKPEGKYRLEDRGVDGRIILKRILEKYFVKLWTEFSWLVVGFLNTVIKFQVP
jgi:hypothetical protein